MNIKLKIGDFIVIILIVIISIGIFFISNKKINNPVTGEKYAVIYVNGVEKDRIKISEENAGLEVPLHTEFGYNKLLFSEDGVRSIEADCPDKIDVKQGFIYKPGETIVCLPNRLVVEIISTEESDVDEVDLVN